MGNYPTSKVVTYAALGGLLGAIVMGAMAYMMPIPNTGGAPFFVAAAMMMGMGSMSSAAGWMLHLGTGLIAGAIFGGAVSKVSGLRLKTTGRALGLGAGAGFVVWLVFFLPMMAMLMPALMGMGTMVGGSFVAHIVFGVVLGGVASLATPRGGSFKCPSCGATFGTKEELMEHGKHHMASKPSEQLKCSACGATFSSQEELTNHKAKAHPM